MFFFSYITYNRHNIYIYNIFQDIYNRNIIYDITDVIECYILCYYRNYATLTKNIIIERSSFVGFLGLQAPRCRLNASTTKGRYVFGWRQRKTNCFKIVADG